MFPLGLRHDSHGAPVATAYIAEAVTAADESRHWCQLAAYWATHAHLPCYLADAPEQSNTGAPSRAGSGSLYVLWSAQLIGQVDVDTIVEFKHAATGFRAIPPSAPNDTAAGGPLYCRYLLVRRSDGGIVSGNAARELIGLSPLPPPPAPLSLAAARDREIAHDDAQFLIRAPVETHVALAARLPDYFVCVRVASQYFTIRFGAVVLAVGVKQGGAAAAPLLLHQPPPSATTASAIQAQVLPSIGFLVDYDGDVTLVSVAVRATGGVVGWVVNEEPPDDAERALAEAGFFTQEGTNAASIQLPLLEVVALLTSWGWAQLAVEDLA